MAGFEFQDGDGCPTYAPGDSLLEGHLFTPTTFLYWLSEARIRVTKIWQAVVCAAVDRTLKLKLSIRSKIQLV